MSDRQYKTHVYMPGVSIVGWTMDDIQAVSMSIDTLREKSEKGKKLVELVAQGFSTKDKPLIMMRGPQIICPCDRCRMNPIHHGFSDEGIIVHNPRKGVMYDGKEPWMVVDPEIALAHEFVHALHFISGDYMATLLEEYRTVGCCGFESEEFSENAVRRDMGLPLRPRY